MKRTKLWGRSKASKGKTMLVEVSDPETNRFSEHEAVQEDGRVVLRMPGHPDLPLMLDGGFLWYDEKRDRYIWRVNKSSGSPWRLQVLTPQQRNPGTATEINPWLYALWYEEDVFRGLADLVGGADSQAAMVWKWICFAFLGLCLVMAIAIFFGS